MNEVRPTFGEITRQSSGDKISVMFEQTDDPTEFRAVHLDGSPVCIFPGDRLWVDVIGAGQVIKCVTEEGSRP